MENTSVTGCIRPETLDRINPNDAGGQYDSSGGQGGNGNPAGSVCTGYVFMLNLHSFFLICDPGITIMWNYWNLLDLGLVFDAVKIQLIVLLPKVRFFHLNYCSSFELGFLLDTQGCPAVIPGNYFNCG